jgi:hypothetical protein
MWRSSEYFDRGQKELDDGRVMVRRRKRVIYPWMEGLGT